MRGDLLVGRANVGFFSCIAYDRGRIQDQDEPF